MMKALNGLDLRDQLGHIGCPALVMYGSRDAVMVAGGAFLAAGQPDVAAHVLPGVGHEAFIEAPELVFPDLRTFLTT